MCSLDQPKANSIAYVSSELRYANRTISPVIKALLVSDKHENHRDLTVIKVADISQALEKVKDLLYNKSLTFSSA